MATVEVEYYYPMPDAEHAEPAIRTLRLSMEGEATERVRDAAVNAVPRRAHIHRVEEVV